MSVDWLTDLSDWLYLILQVFKPYDFIWSTLHIIICIILTRRVCLQIFSDLLVYINSSTNFLIFAVMGKRFRVVMMQQLCKTKKRRRKAARLASMASLELIRSISELTLRTSVSASRKQTLRFHCENNNNSDVTVEDLSRLHKLNHIINSRLNSLHHTTLPFNSLSRRHSWTLETSKEDLSSVYSASEDNDHVAFQKKTKRRSSEPNTLNKRYRRM